MNKFEARARASSRHTNKILVFAASMFAAGGASVAAPGGLDWWKDCLGFEVAGVAVEVCPAEDGSGTSTVKTVDGEIAIQTYPPFVEGDAAPPDQVSMDRILDDLPEDMTDARTTIHIQATVAEDAVSVDGRQGSGNLSLMITMPSDPFSEEPCSAEQHLLPLIKTIKINGVPVLLPPPAKLDDGGR